MIGVVPDIIADTPRLNDRIRVGRGVVARCRVGSAIWWADCRGIGEAARGRACNGGIDGVGDDCATLHRHEGVQIARTRPSATGRGDGSTAAGIRHGAGPRTKGKSCRRRVGHGGCGDLAWAVIGHLYRVGSAAARIDTAHAVGLGDGQISHWVYGVGVGRRVVARCRVGGSTRRTDCHAVGEVARSRSLNCRSSGVGDDLTRLHSHGGVQTARTRGRTTGGGDSPSAAGIGHAASPCAKAQTYRLNIDNRGRSHFAGSIIGDDHRINSAAARIDAAHAIGFGDGQIGNQIDGVGVGRRVVAGYQVDNIRRQGRRDAICHRTASCGDIGRDGQGKATATRQGCHRHACAFQTGIRQAWANRTTRRDTAWRTGLGQAGCSRVGKHRVIGRTRSVIGDRDGISSRSTGIYASRVIRLGDRNLGLQQESKIIGRIDIVVGQ